jgi:hypothetical protein
MTMIAAALIAALPTSRATFHDAFLVPLTSMSDFWRFTYVATGLLLAVLVLVEWRVRAFIVRRRQVAVAKTES